MKRKTTSLTIALLLLSLLLVVSTSAVSSVAAYGYDYGWGEASVIYSTQWLTFDTDEYQIHLACEQIYDLFAEQYYWVWHPYYGWVPYRPVYGHLQNYEAQIYWDIVKPQIIDCEQDHAFTTVLYLGHGQRERIYPGYDYWRYFIYEQASHDDPYDPPPQIYDNHPSLPREIYPYTVKNHHFVFLWACRQGDEAGNAYPIRGMAYCWTRQPDLSPDGYGDPNIPGDPDSRPYSFIGFQEASPRLSEWMNENNIYKFWLVFFYYFALYWHGYYTINDALDAASVMVGYEGGWLDPYNPLSQGFWTYWPPHGQNYWGKMRIYGNGDIYLPASVAL